MKSLFVILLLSIGASAYATNIPTPPASTSQSRSSAGAAAKANAARSAKSQSHSSATGGTATGGNAQQQQAQTQYQAQTSVTGGNAFTVENHERLQAPAVVVPAIYASGPCASGWSAGVSIPGGGISGGKTKSDTPCDRRELARVMTPLNAFLALKILCADPMAAAVASGDDCVYVEKRAEQVNATPSPATCPDTSQLATKEEVRRVFEKCQSK